MQSAQGPRNIQFEFFSSRRFATWLLFVSVIEKRKEFRALFQSFAKALSQLAPLLVYSNPWIMSHNNAGSPIISV